MTGMAGGPGTVLIVEDEFITGTDIQNSLQDMGYNAPVVIDNGPEAIQKAGLMRPDVVLMDITLMGPMSGIEAAERIRADFGIPVIYLTAHSDEATMERALVSEPFGYIIKPFEPRNLRISIEMARYKHAIDEKLRSSEERYRGFVQNFLGIAYRLNPDFSIVFLHGATESITGYREKEFMEGTITWQQLLHPDDAPEILEENARIRNSPEYATAREYRILRKDGSICWVHELLQKVGKTGSSTGYLQGACYDITEQKHAEDAVRLANRKLNLLNNITRHDILNSIHGLFGLLEMARDVVRDPEMQELLSDMQVSAEQVQRQIAFTRNYQDVGVKAPAWQGIGACIARAVQALPQDPVTISIAIDDDLEVFADPLLEKVFYNLVDNALRYGETLTRIRFTAEFRDHDLILVCQDDGAGVDAGEKERIFLQCVGKNTGMGLFLSREILMITSIGIHECGEAGKGARFEICIPPGSWRSASRIAGSAR
ncbi:MAG: response regulator [Methanomicrobiales archaeon]|nr:response regulator [Methanomicrobiales archaeon]